MKNLVLTLALLMGAHSAGASEVEELTNLLQDFLANADKEAAHVVFWADDLVYSSSDGLRFGKADILAGFESAEDEEGAEEGPDVVYSGEDVDVRLYGDTAVVAFKLVGTPTNEAPETDVLYFYNTGTFVKRDGSWQAVAWQATKIPSR